MLESVSEKERASVEQQLQRLLPNLNGPGQATQSGKEVNELIFSMSARRLEGLTLDQIKSDSPQAQGAAHIAAQGRQLQLDEGDYRRELDALNLLLQGQEAFPKFKIVGFDESPRFDQTTTLGVQVTNGTDFPVDFIRWELAYKVDEGGFVREDKYTGQSDFSGDLIGRRSPIGPGETVKWKMDLGGRDFNTTRDNVGQVQIQSVRVIAFASADRKILASDDVKLLDMPKRKVQGAKTVLDKAKESFVAENG